MDTSFPHMQKLLHAVWPAVAQIDWAQYCGRNVSAYDDQGIPKYTGLLLHRSGGGCIGATTEQVGFLPRPEKSASLVVIKTRLIQDNAGISCSMERRNPAENYWGGGIRSSDKPDQAEAITGLPEIGDHLLLAQMKLKCGTLMQDDWASVTRSDSSFMLSARDFVDMGDPQFEELSERVQTLVEDAMRTL